MRNFLLIGLFIVITRPAWTQEVPVYSQFTRNPYLYNPAFAGSKHAPVAYLTHRRQWMGIEGAPVTSVLSFHTPLKFRDRLGIGVKISSDSRGLLSTSSALIGISYCLSLSEHQRVRMGLSAGGGSTQLLEYDPVLVNYPNNQFNPQGEVGLLYQYKQTQLSVALPRVFRPGGFSSGKSEPGNVSPLKHIIFMASQSVALSPRLAVEPSLLYRITESLPNQLEVVGMLHLYDAVRVGASYRQDYGTSVLAEFHRKEIVSVGYTYELATSPVGGLKNGTHEIQVSFRLGKERKATLKKVKEKTEEQPESARKEPKPALDEVPKPVRTAKTKKQKKSAASPSEANNGQEIPPGQTLDKEIVTIRRSSVQADNELENKYYVIAGAFNINENAIRYKEQVLATGLYAELKFSSETKYYYVYLLSTTDLAQAIDGRNKIKKLKAYRKAWILAVK